MIEPNTEYIYSLNDPITGECRYIGRTFNLYQRYYNHCKSGTLKHSYNTNLCDWITKLKEKGLMPIPKIEEVCHSGNSIERESYHISMNKATSFNIKTAGGGKKDWRDSRNYDFYCEKNYQS